MKTQKDPKNSDILKNLMKNIPRNGNIKSMLRYLRVLLLIHRLKNIFI